MQRIKTYQDEAINNYALKDFIKIKEAEMKLQKLVCEMTRYCGLNSSNIENAERELSLLKSDILNKLSKLDEEEKQVLLLYYLKNYPLDMIAAKMYCSWATAARLKARALKNYAYICEQA